MAGAPTDKYSAGEQGLGYIYQARLALLYRKRCLRPIDFSVAFSGFGSWT